MNQATHISHVQFEELTKRINQLEQIVTKLLEKEAEPHYGTDAWWEWSDKKALDAIKKGEYKKFNSAKEMVQHLKKLSAKS